MNNLSRYIVVTVALLLLQACGLKGDLYLENPEGKASESNNTRETLPPMPEVETSLDDSGSGIAEDMGTIEGLASPEEVDTSGSLDESTIIP